MAERGKHRVAPTPAAKRQYAYTPCPRSEEVGTEFALHLLNNHSEAFEQQHDVKSPPGESEKRLQTFFRGKVMVSARGKKLSMVTVFVSFFRFSVFFGPGFSLLLIRKYLYRY